MVYCSKIECYIISKLEHMRKEDQFEVLRKIKDTADSSQRELAEELGLV